MISAKIEPINKEYDYYTLGDVKIIHLIRQDKFQVESILQACKTSKNVDEWEKENQELLNAAIDDDDNVIQIISNGEYKGTYISEILFHSVAFWASPVNSLQIIKMFNELRTLKYRPFFYLLSFYPQQFLQNEGFTVLKVSRPNVNVHLERYEKQLENKFFLAENLPVVTTLHQELKKKLRRHFSPTDFRCFQIPKTKDQKAVQNLIKIRTNLLPQLKQFLENYFTTIK